MDYSADHRAYTDRDRHVQTEVVLEFVLHRMPPPDDTTSEPLVVFEFKEFYAGSSARSPRKPALSDSTIRLRRTHKLTIA